MFEATISPVLFALLAAVFFGGQGVPIMRGLKYVTPLTGTMISMGTCVLIFWLLAPFLLRAAYWLSPGLWIFIANGLVYPLFSMYLSFEGTRRLGATICATISATAPFFSAAGALLLLGEHINLHLIMGTLGTVAGVMILSWKRSGSAKWALSALIFPIGVALIRGASHNMGKFGLNILPSPYFAGLVTFTVSFAGTVVLHRFRFGSFQGRFPRLGLMWCGLAGVCIAMGVLFGYMALKGGQVVMVAPIISSFPLFTYLYSLVFRQEVLGVRLLFGVILVVAGIVWIGFH